VLAAVAFWLDGKRAQQSLRMEVAQRLSGIESSTQAAGNAQTQLATEMRDAQAKITLLEARLAESQAEQAALEALYRDLAPSRDEIAISEIEQVLLVASQQLQLAGNVPSALTALQLAEAKLQRPIVRSSSAATRLARDIDRLKAVPYVDVVGMSLKLDQGLAAVDTLPLAMDERVPPGRPQPCQFAGALVPLA
jgi:uroporphyrin-3 C-methyltransferase